MGCRLNQLRKKLERELTEINQLKSELLERTSHELKTPLISVKGFTDLLLDLLKEKFDGKITSDETEVGALFTIEFPNKEKEMAED